MDQQIKEKFITLWRKYFAGADLPITFYYTDDEGCAQKAKAPIGHRCIFGPLARVRKGEPLCFDSEAAGCGGARRYLGFSDEIGPDFPFFLSYGIPGKVEGERYKRTPELVEKFIKRSTLFKAPGRYIVFKRWDALNEFDEPECVICFAHPDVIAGPFHPGQFRLRRAERGLCAVCRGVRYDSPVPVPGKVRRPAAGGPRPVRYLRPPFRG